MKGMEQIFEKHIFPELSSS